MHADVVSVLSTTGNDKLAALTATRQHVLRVELGDWSNNRRWAEFNSFKVQGEAQKYRLSSIGTYSGNAGTGQGLLRP